MMTALIMFSGCDTDDNRDYEPPAGQGALIIENDTGTDIRFFLEGVEQREVDSFDDRTYNLDPGVYRVVLTEEDGQRSYREDVDILEGNLTILNVTDDTLNPSAYDVFLSIEEPD